MMGLMVLGFSVVYLAASVWAVKAASSWAKANNKKPWLWGGLAAFVMYNLVFWDLIPTLVAHKYYCETQAGSWVYKTPEQWKTENSYLELKPSNRRTYEGTDNDHIATESINHRMNYVSKMNPAGAWLPIYKTENYLENSETKQILIQRKDYFSGYRERNGVGQLKLWMAGKGCLDNRKDHDFYQILEQFKNIN